VSRPTRRVAPCSAHEGASLSRNHSAGDLTSIGCLKGKRKAPRRARSRGGPHSLGQNTACGPATSAAVSPAVRRAALHHGARAFERAADALDGAGIPAHRRGARPATPAVLHHRRRRGAVACGDDGIASFDRIRHRRHDAGVFLYAFDLMELDGDDLRRDPLNVRKTTLAKCARARWVRPAVERAPRGGWSDRVRACMQARPRGHRFKEERFELSFRALAALDQVEEPTGTGRKTGSRREEWGRWPFAKTRHSRR
jgi:hypothetical protein